MALKGEKGLCRQREKENGNSCLGFRVWSGKAGSADENAGLLCNGKQGAYDMTGKYLVSATMQA